MKCSRMEQKLKKPCKIKADKDISDGIGKYKQTLDTVTVILKFSF